MKHLTVILSILTAFSSYGQGNTKETKTVDFKSIQIGINFSPNVSYRTLKNNDGRSSSNFVVDQMNKTETAKFGYNAGLNVCFNLQKFIGLETGIQYSNQGYQTKKQTLTFEQPNPSSPKQAKFIYDFHYIDIPVKVNFTFGEQKIRLFTSLGVTTNIFIKQTQTSFLYYGDRSNTENSETNFNYNRINISPAISAGIDYKINSSMNLRVEPTFRYGVLKTIDTPVTAYLYSGGLNISYYFGL
ncbi:MAG: PorT family protein [Bacteroidetes bacterium]|nr:MAG: PorT family protein [Bacteroidota bacterium]